MIDKLKNLVKNWNWVIQPGTKCEGLLTCENKDERDIVLV